MWLGPIGETGIIRHTHGHTSFITVGTCEESRQKLTCIQILYRIDIRIKYDNAFFVSNHELFVLKLG